MLWTLLGLCLVSSKALVLGHDAVYLEFESEDAADPTDFELYRPHSTSQIILNHYDPPLTESILRPRQRVSLPVEHPTKSFWLDTPGANPLADEGSKGPLSEKADVCIIGSGMTGSSAAWHISNLFKGASDPLSVVVLEARKFCKLS